MDIRRESTYDKLLFRVNLEHKALNTHSKCAVSVFSNFGRNAEIALFFNPISRPGGLPGVREHHVGDSWSSFKIN